jgi:hypothetical protein
MVPDLWSSWSRAGRVRASQALGCDVEGVLPTTNHLESFNRTLKRRYIRHWQRGGKRLRLDVLIHHLVHRIIPAIFGIRFRRNAFLLWRDQRFPTPGLSSRIQLPMQGPLFNPPLAWIPARNGLSDRQLEGQDIAKHNRIFNVTYLPLYGVLLASCLSSRLATTEGSDPVSYRLELHLSSYGSCSCPDFHYRSSDNGACKHLFGLLSYVHSLRISNPHCLVPPLSLPSSRSIALELYQQHSQSRITREAQVYQPLAEENPDLLLAATTLVDMLANPASSVMEDIPDSNQLANRGDADAQVSSTLYDTEV